MATFDKLLSKQFIEKIQDYGLFDMSMNTIETDYFYEGVVEQIPKNTVSVITNQHMYTSLLVIYILWH